TLDEAKTYFNAGAEAFDSGNYSVAVQAFEQAYRLAPRPGLLFSIGQSYRRQFHITHSPEDAREALTYYRQYLEKVPNGGRRSEANSALNELESAVAHRTESATVALPAKAPTRIMVSSSRTERARVALDHEAPSDAPLIEEVTPGKHAIKISADG